MKFHQSEEMLHFATCYLRSCHGVLRSKNSNTQIHHILTSERCFLSTHICNMKWNYRDEVKTMTRGQKFLLFARN